MGVVPYINSSIIFQLLTIAVPALEQLSKEGEEGRKKIQEYTKYAAVILGFIQAYGQYAIITHFGAVKDNSAFNVFLIMITLTTASTFLMWFGDQITEHGIGNGISFLIFANIISRLPGTVYRLAELQKGDPSNIIAVVIFSLASFALFVAVVIVSLAERRIPVQYAGKTGAQGRLYKGQSTHIPINVNSSAVIGIIFAISVMQFPATIAQFFPDKPIAKFITSSNYSLFKENSWQYMLTYFVLTIFFTWFYTLVTMKPDEMAENMHKSSGFIPGIRPGDPTAKYIERILDKVSILGGAFAAMIAIFPMLLQTKFPGIQFGGTSLLIEVGVALETIRQIESQLVMRHYQGFLK
jgi:preprotein translocase subunit SecY